MKRHEFFFWLIRIPLEFLIVMASFWLAKAIRISTDLIPGIYLPTRSIDPLYVIGIAFVSYCVIVTIFCFQKLYSIDRTRCMIEEIFTVIKSLLVSFFIVIGLIYLTNGFPYQTILIPRLMLIYAFLIAACIISIFRIIMHRIQLFGLQAGWFHRRNILLVMHHPEEESLTLFRHEPRLRVAGYIAPLSHDNGLPYLGTLSQHAEAVIHHAIEEMVILSHDLPYEMRKTLFEYCQIHGVRYRYVGNLYEINKHNTYIDFIGRVPFIEIRTIGITPWGRVIKRTCDIILSLMVIVGGLPFWIVIALMIKIDSPGPILYAQERVGRMGKTFRMYKFRSMYTHLSVGDEYGGAAAQKNWEKLKSSDQNIRQGVLQKIHHDPRVTRLGRWLRKWSIDEFPQFWNILMSDMSLIGPRPHLPSEVAQYTEKQRQILTIKPGLTCMAQVNGRHRNTLEREIELDLFYIENWSLLLDTKILLLTFRVALQ